MKFRFVFTLVGVIALMMWSSGCENARTRAQQHPAAFAKLSADDQRLVLAGKVRAGMSADAVHIAWGDPDGKRATGTGKEAGESWLYHRQLTVKAPPGSFDQLSYGNSVFGMTVPLAANAGFGFGGIGNEGGLLYQPHLQIADATVKQADFRNGKLERYRLYPGQFNLPR